MTADFPAAIASAADLEEVYGEPMGAAVEKTVDRLDEHCRAFIARSPFLAIGAVGADGRIDVSPRGGPAGFVRILDDRRLLIPDATGNRQIGRAHV